ncbi:MAG: hypothetical protein ACYDBA_11590 [Sulfuricaulis sp.]
MPVLHETSIALKLGGIVIVPLLLLAILVLAIMVEKVFRILVIRQFYRSEVLVPDLSAQAAVA